MCDIFEDLFNVWLSRGKRVSQICLCMSSVVAFPTLFSRDRPEIKEVMFNIKWRWTRGLPERLLRTPAPGKAL